MGGEWGGRRLRTLKGKSVRPTSDRVKEAWFSALAHRVRGAVVLDLFAGSGALGLEALSRGAAHVTFVDRQRAAIGVIQANLRLLRVSESDATVVAADVFRTLKGLTHQCDLALADPPYGKGLAEQLVEEFLAKPFAKALWVEHRTGELPADLPGARSRRYGDTTLTTIETTDE